jgi:ABC-type polysaccharide/polyol phosphate transport system ATPase subunit
MQPDFEKANEIYFRLGIIYKQQAKYNQSLEVCYHFSELGESLLMPAKHSASSTS